MRVQTLALGTATAVAAVTDVRDQQLQALAQTLEMVQHNRVRSLTGEWAHVIADTVCLHGDGEHALDFARRLRAAFAGRNIQVSAETEE